MMKILRDNGYKVSFASEVFDASEPFLDELRGSGIDVPDTSREGAIGALLDREGAEFTLCVSARPAVSDRWIEALGRQCPHARIIADDCDLRSDGVPLVEKTSTAERVRVLRSDCDDSSPPDTSAVLPHIHEPVTTPTAHHERQGVFLVTGFQDDVTADSLMWLREEIIPLTAGKTPRPLSFALRERDWTQHLVAGCDALQTTPELELARPNGLDRFRVAVAPTRFGASLTAPIEAVLARGIPCVATSHAASGMSAHFGDAIVIADHAEDIAEALLELLCNEALWNEASQAAQAHISALFPYEVAAETLLAATR